ncbi:MAG: YitT family protein [Ruminococcaceae bacterium]|nr:YitT family protein [Oscillospiraceae bacterium]
MGKKLQKESIHVLLTVLAALLSAVTLHVFVYKNNFAPSGVDGIATMVQALTTLNAGIVTLAINIPLLIVAWKILNKKYVIYTLLFTFLSSGFIMLLDYINFPQYEAMYEKVVAAVFSGLLLGVRTGIMIRLGFSTGGIDIIAAVFQKNRSHINIERIISIICYVITALSYFVYWDLGAILLSIIQMFVFEKGVALLLSDHRDAVAFHIITKEPEKIKEDIIYNLKHGATVMESKGLFTDAESYMIISIVNKRQIPEFISIVKKHKDTFMYYSDINGVSGNFRWKKDDIVK